jgi:hypothetical protein
LEKHCIHCGKLFFPRDERQQYCGAAICERARKRTWHRKRLATDAAYKGNQADAQRLWRVRHPDYWREYRARHQDYCERNREQQRKRNGLRKGVLGGCVRASAKLSTCLQPDGGIAKMDAGLPLKSGTYRLVPYGVPLIAKMDAMVVELSLVSTG